MAIGERIRFFRNLRGMTQGCSNRGRKWLRSTAMGKFLVRNMTSGDTGIRGWRRSGMKRHVKN